MRVRLRRFGKLAAFSLLGVLGFELLARLLFPGFDINPSWRYHPVLGWSQVPGGRFEYDLDGERVRIAFNSEGFHDVEHAVDKPDGVKRIVLIGDSFSESVQLDLERTFFRLLEARLNAMPGAHWEVINLGVGDFGTAQEELALEHLGLRYAPDIVICQVFPLNDIGNNSLALADLCKSRNDRYRPYAVVRDGELQTVRLQPLRAFLRRSLVSFTVVEGLLLRWSGAFAPESDADYRRRLRDRGFDGLEPLLQTFVAEPDQAPAVAEGWRVTELLLERIVGRCRAAGIAVLPMVVPWDRRFGPDWRGLVAAHPALIRGYPERRLGALFARLGVPSLMLLPLFEHRLDVVLPARAGHLNPAAHRLVADALFEKLRAEKLVR